MTATKYDVVIIGAGIAGLTCANYLVSAGKRVLILEHNHQAGGLMGGFWRKGFYFDAGDQSFEQGNMVFPILQDFGLFQKEDWEPADYASRLPQGEIVFKDKKEVIEQLADFFPHERQNIYNYFEDLERFVIPMRTMFYDYPSPIFAKGIDRIKGIYGSLKTVLKHGDVFKEGIIETGANHAERFIPGYGFGEKFSQMGYRNMSAFMGVGFWFSWFEDYWYPRYGLQGLMNKFVERFTRLGGEIRFHQTVEEIVVKNGRAVGARTAQGDEFFGEWIVFAGSTKRLYTEYLSPNLLDPSLIRQMDEGVVSEPMNAVYLGVDIPRKELKKYLSAHHTILMLKDFFADYDDFDDPKLHQKGFIEISCPSYNNPNLAPRGKNALVLQINTAYHWMNNWGTEGDDFKRTKKYKSLKKKVMNEIIKGAEEVIPNLRDRIVYQDMGTPMSTIRFTLNPEGASAGWTYDHEKSVLKGKYLSLFTPVRNLLTIGHYAIWPGGVPLAAVTGLMGARAVQRGRYLNPIYDLMAIRKRLKR